MCKALISKKGLSHADWVISMGIFIVAIISLFIFLRPGAQPVYQSDTLLSIVERGLKEDVVWSVKEVPLFIWNCESYITDEDEIKSATIEINDLSDSRWDGWVYDSAGNYVGIGLTIKCNDAFSVDNLNTARSYLVRLHSNDEQPEEPVLELELEPSAGVNPKAKLGASESIEGINENWLKKLKSSYESEDEYKNLKTKWVYPESRDFVIYKNNNFFLGKEPSNQVSVFVKEWKTWILDESGSKEEILISMRVY